MLVLWAMGIAKIALDPPLCQKGQRGKKVPQTILASPHTPGQMWGKSAPNHPGKPHPPPSRAMLIYMESTHFPYSVLTTIGPTRFSPTHPFCCTNLNRKFVEIYPKVIFICLTLKSNLQLGAGVWMEWIEKVLGTKNGLMYRREADIR